MKINRDIIWLIIKPKETIKIVFSNLNLLEKWLLKQIMKKRKIEILKDDLKLRGRTFSTIFVDECAK